MGNFNRFFSALVFILLGSTAWTQTCATENFANLPTTNPGSYQNRSWTGTDGTTWTAVGARTDQTLTGKAICFGTSGTRSVTSPTYTGGLGTLSFSYVRGFTGTGSRTLQVFINGTQAGGNITVNNTSNTAAVYSVTHNITGNIEVEIRASGSQIIVDEITWTCYSSGVSANFTASSSTVCSGSTVTFTNTSTGTSGSSTYAWSFGANASPSSASGIGPHTVIYTGSGTSDVALTVTDGTSDTETKLAFIITVELPTVSIGPAVAAICQGETTLGLGGAFGGSATTAVWSDGGAGGTFANNGGSTPGTATYTASLNAPSVVTLTLTSAGGGCGSASDTKTLTINPLPDAPIANANTSPQTTNVNITDFDANWSAVPGATSYLVYVIQPGSSSITETFTNVGDGTSSSYLTRTWTGDGGIGWTAYNSRIDQVLFPGNEAITLRDSPGAYLESDGISGNPILVSFHVQQKFAGTGGILTLKIAHGPGFATTTTIGTTNITTVLQEDVTFNISGITGPFKIVLENNGAVRPCIDNLTFDVDSSVPVLNSPFTSSGTSINISGLTSDVTYEYFVTAINSCGEGPSSNAVSATLGCLAPTSSSSSAVLNGSSTTTLDFSWSSGNGENRIIMAKAGSSAISTPTDGSTYASSSDFSMAPTLGDAVVVYNGNSNSLEVSGLTPGTTYFFTIFEYNCGVGSEKYFTTPYEFSLTTKPENVALTENCTTSSTHELSWSFGAGNFDGVIIFARDGATSSGPGVTDASTYAANADFSLAADLGARGRVVYKGTGTNVTISGLTAGVNYSFSAFTYINENSTVWSTGTTMSQTIGINDVSNFSVIGGNEEASVSWTNPAVLCFDEILVVANQGAVSFSPSGDGSAYAANPVYSSSNQVVYKGNGTAVVVSGLTNLQEYCFRIFVRVGTEWSFGFETCVIPTTVTEFEPGDIAIVAINTQVLSSGSSDEICFVSFKTITEGTTFFITDNGYERTTEGLWGDTEGVARFTRNLGAAEIPAGTTICINGPYSTDPRYDIIVCGVLDNNNWTIDPNVIGSPTGASSFDLNSTDQVWITQGGAWTNPSGSHNVSYSGNVLYGWSGIDWKENIGSTAPTWGTSGSRLLPRTECFTTSLGTVTNNDKTKYTGPMTPTTKVGWITRINDQSNWSGYATNGDYDSENAAYDYFGECIIFPLEVSTEIAGKWIGSADDNWFNCSNWDTRTVPDSTINVTIANAPGLNSNCKVDVTADFAYLYNNDAVCGDITIADKALIVEASPANVLRVKGDLTISTAGSIDMDDSTPAADGIIELSKNWTSLSNAAFFEGESTVKLIGTTSQLISTTDGEVFHNLAINSTEINLGSSISIGAELQMINGNIIGNGHSTILGTSSSTTGSLNHSSGRVVGTFERWVSGMPSDMLFPIGSSVANQFALVSLNSSSAGKIISAFNALSPSGAGLPYADNNFSVEALFSEGYWSLEAGEGLAPSSINIELQTSNFISQAFTPDTPIAFRPISSADWMPLGVHQPANVPSVYRNSVTQFGEFAIGAGRNCLTSLESPSTMSQVVCNTSELVPLTIVANDGDGPFTYQWYLSSTNTSSGGISLGSANGAQTSTLSFPADFEGAGYFYAVVSQENSACTPLSSVPSYAQLINTLPVSVELSPATVQLCSSQTEQTFGYIATNVGATPTAQWYLNGSPVGSGENPITLSALSDADEVFVSITSSEFCTSGQIFNSATATVVMIPEITFYQDADGDGFGNELVSIQGCEMPIGYVTYPLGDINSDGQPDFDCDDTDYEINPAGEEFCNAVDDNCNGTINEGITFYTFYADLDGDGYGDPNNSISTCSNFVPGYITNNTDCNDATANAHPGLNETCDGIDNDCDGAIDEVCGPPNDLKQSALILYPNNYGSCNGSLGTLIGATVSSESQSLVITGEDVWYYFTSPTSGVSIQCNSNSDIVLEVQSESGISIESENMVAGNGWERLNYAGLTPGATYYVVVRNYNSNATPNSTFNLCVQVLQPSFGSNANQPISLCSFLKAQFTNANQYIYHFPFGTINGPYASVIAGSNNTYLMLEGIQEVTYSTVYTPVLVDAVYSIPNGAGTIEHIVVPGVVPCTMTTVDQPSLALKTADQCPFSKSLGAMLRAEPNICGNIIDYEWEFVETYPGFGLPIYVNRNAADRYFRVSWIPGVLPGMEFEVRIRPIYAGNILGEWSTVPSCLKIIGLANFEIDGFDDNMLLSSETEQSFGGENLTEFTLYPNPSHGDYLGIKGDNSVTISEISIFDFTGRLCYKKESINTSNLMITLPQPLSSGSYSVQIVWSDGGVSRKKWIVSN